MKHNVAIQVEELSKRYSLGKGRHRHNTLRDLLTDGFKSLVRRDVQSQLSSRETFWALKDITFEISRGENVGIIGLNGAGKSTLLKILSRITMPTAGSVQLADRVGALLEVGTGFHAELTGRENVYLYGAILGMSSQEISRKFDAIVDFAEISDFIDTPVKRYSSGMYVRLAFAVAAHLEPEILLLDEVLSVGDLPFQRKCMDFAKGLQQANATILFVSHNMFSIKTMCKRVIYLKRGQIQYDGPTDHGIEFYEKDCQLNASDDELGNPDEWPVIITKFALSDENGHTKTVFDYGERMRIRLTYETRRSVESPNFLLMIKRSDGVACCDYSTELDGVAIGNLDGKGVVELLTPPLKLVSDVYTIKVLVRKNGFQDLICEQIGSNFHIRHGLLDKHFGVFYEHAQWSHERDN